MASVLFTNHLRVLGVLTREPTSRLRDIAHEVGVTERATQRIIGELIDAGYLSRTRVGARNRYAVNGGAQLNGAPAGQTVADAVGLLADRAATAAATVVEAGGTTGLMQAAFAAVPAAIALADADGRVIAANPAFCALAGRDEPELVGHHLCDWTDPEDAADDDAGLRRLRRGECTEYGNETRYLLPDGGTRWVALRARSSVDPHTGARCIVAHVSEIGPRRRQAQARAEAEERFRSVIDHAPIGVALVAPDGRFLKVNHALCELCGYAETELLLRTFQDITHPGDLDADNEHVRRMLAGEIRTYQLDKRFRHADGHLIWISLSVSLVRDMAGEPLYFISQIKDITERRGREDTIRRVVDRIAGPVSIVDADGTHLHVNPASRAALGELRAQFDDRPVAGVDWAAVSEDGAPLPPSRLPVEITRLTGREVDGMVVGFPLQTGELRWLRVSTRRLSDGPAPYQVVASYEDVADHRAAARAPEVAAAHQSS